MDTQHDIFQAEPWNRVDLEKYDLIEFNHEAVGKVWVPIERQENARLRKMGDVRIYQHVILNLWKKWEHDKNSRIDEYRKTHPYDPCTDPFNFPSPHSTSVAVATPSRPATSSTGTPLATSSRPATSSAAAPLVTPGSSSSTGTPSRPTTSSAAAPLVTPGSSSSTGTPSRPTVKRARKRMEGMDENDGMKTKIWTDKTIKCLLGIRFEMEHRFLNPTETAVSLWNEISTKMNEEGFAIEGKPAHEKFRNLYKTYMQIKQRQKKTGESAAIISWQYFETFDKVFAGRAKVSIPVDHVAETLNADDAESDPPTEPNTTRGMTPAAYRQAKLGISSAKLDFKKLQHKEKVELERERTAAMVGCEERKLQLMSQFMQNK